MNDELERLMREATDTHPLPWTVTESTGMDEAWCDWHDIGPLSMPGGKPDKALSLMYAAVNALPELLAKVKRLEAQCKALSYVHEGAVTQAREYLQEQLGVTIDPIDMSDAIGSYLEVVTRATNKETKP